MNPHILQPRKALNKAYLKVKPIRSDIEKFKCNLISVLDQINEAESEEFHKNLLSDFLKKTYCDPAHSINTKGRTVQQTHVIEEKSGQIFKSKNNNSYADISHLESQIVHVVYELDEMTAEGVGIVERGLK